MGKIDRLAKWEVAAEDFKLFLCGEMELRVREDSR